MARCVARAGYKVAAYDIDPGRAASLAADGVKPAASISVVASGEDVLVLMVATPGQVEGVVVVDAPVSGGVARAAGGDLLVMVGGAQTAVERVQPLLDAMASSAPVVGSAPGHGRATRVPYQTDTHGTERTATVTPPGPMTWPPSSLAA
jgi:3-hydroxyisobutyrate dehydrogenase/putative dehydrogenase